MLNKREVLNKPHANVVCTVCYKMNLFWKHCRFVTAQNTASWNCKYFSQ